MPLLMRWRTSTSFVNIRAPKCSPTPRKAESIKPRTNPNCSTNASQILSTGKTYMIFLTYFMVQHLCKEEERHDTKPEILGMLLLQPSRNPSLQMHLQVLPEI
jgi:hypothetical protein